MSYGNQGVTAFDLAVQNERLTTASILKDLTGGMTAAELRDGKDQGAEGDMAATAGTLHRTQKKKVSTSEARDRLRR